MKSCPIGTSMSIAVSRVPKKRAAGVGIGTPVTYAPRAIELANGRIGGTAVDDRAACAVLLEVARAAKQGRHLPPIHLVFSVQEEFNLRGAVTAAQTLMPDIAIQLDLVLATDNPTWPRAARCASAAGRP